MARIRSIKPAFFRHEGLFEAEKETGFPLRIAFAGLWTAADREGRFKWSPRNLKLDCLPYDDVDFSRVLDALVTRGFIVKYASDGVEYGSIPTWKAHQVINNRESPSELPEPNESNTLTRATRVDDACPTPLKYAQGEGKGREGEGNGDSVAKATGASAPQIASPTGLVTEPEVYRLGRDVLGKNCGGVITSLRKHCRQDLREVRDLIEQAREKAHPMEWVQGVLRGTEAAKMPLHQVFPEDVYRNVL